MAQNVRSVVRLLLVGIFAWVIAGVIALVIGADAKLIWTCFAGALLGILGLTYTIRRAHRGGI
ncbi:MAG: DUF2530 domain-containing protein [Actinobacteria bacterium]|nr:DUF2530 domain-containing protein [Actinomycetota bacterium]